MRTARHGRRRGITLLEIVLALALAAVAISMLAQLVNIGNRASVVARDQSKAQIIAQSITSEYTSGVAGTPDMITSSSGVWEADADWSYEVQVTPTSSGTMNIVTVTATQVEAKNPASYTMTQWLAIPPEPEEETTTDTEGGAI